MRLFVLAVSIAALVTAAQTTAQTRPTTLEIIPPNDFLRLPEQMQSAYIGGVLEGMSFTSYGYSLPDYPHWVECVRRETLGTTAKQVAAFLRARPDFAESVASAVAQTLGARCKKAQ